MADAIGGGLHLGKVDAQFLGASADGGGCEDRLAKHLLLLRRQEPKVQRRNLAALGSCLRRSIAAVGSGSLRNHWLHGRLRVERFVRRRRRGGDVALDLDLDQHRTDRHLVPRFPRQPHDDARDWAFHLDRRLVGHHVGDRLVFLDPIPDLDVPADDLGFRYAFADVRQLECKESHALNPS